MQAVVALTARKVVFMSWALRNCTRPPCWAAAMPAARDADVCSEGFFKPNACICVTIIVAASVGLALISSQ